MQVCQIPKKKKKNTYSHIHTQDTQLKCNSIMWFCSGPAMSPSQNTVNTPQHLGLTLTGLLECRKRDENRLIKNLITGRYTHTHTHTSHLTVCLQCSSYIAYCTCLNTFHMAKKTDRVKTKKTSCIWMAQLCKVILYRLKIVSYNYRCQTVYLSSNTQWLAIWAC